IQNHGGRRVPDAVKTVEILEGKGTTRPYTVIDDAAGLVALVQYGVLEFHLWGAQADRVDAPDRIVFDLDPAPGVAWTQVKQAARLVREVIGALGLESWIKTTGGKGI